MALIAFLVEDNKTIRDQLIPTLEELTNARVLGAAETELEAVHWMTTHDGMWDIAVVDMFLKEGSGLGVLRGCKDRKPHQRVVILSNYATPDIRAQCLALGADAIFDKSTELEALFQFMGSMPGNGTATSSS
ncbi:chemotaxis protein CheY [Variovorax paradoxus]|uniref:Chemotaxis protein CheY n=1 Tax=Variovorax paradoxus TaxID=34073 RepID=A0A0D0LM99_VARPD|nr:response regulator [Variovorax paradoxus]KIQ18510.1 chemotaxis protein CheY [Variovorax paradoxus]